MGTYGEVTVEVQYFSYLYQKNSIFQVLSSNAYIFGKFPSNALPLRLMNPQTGQQYCTEYNGKCMNKLDLRGRKMW
jgi:hypothetical protein